MRLAIIIIFPLFANMKMGIKSVDGKFFIAKLFNGFLWEVGEIIF